MNRFKNRVCVALAALSPIAIFAADPDPSQAQQVQSAVVQMMTDAQTNLSSLLTAALPVIGIILGSSIVLWAGFKLFRLVQKAFGWGAR